jgi:hypothetical protein
MIYPGINVFRDDLGMLGIDTSPLYLRAALEDLLLVIEYGV